MFLASPAVGFSFTEAALLVFSVPATSVVSTVVAAVVMQTLPQIQLLLYVAALVVSSEELVTVALVVGSFVTTTASVVLLAFAASVISEAMVKVPETTCSRCRFWRSHHSRPHQ